MKYNFYFSLILLFLNILSINLISQKSGHEPLIKYKNNLDKVILKIVENQIVPLMAIEKCIPNTEGNYSYYYHYTYPDKSEDEVKAFYKLDSMIYKNAETGKMNFPEKVFLMADFVDGEYAEPYFEDYIKKIALKNKKCFCNTFIKISEKNRLQLEDFYSNLCKK